MTQVDIIVPVRNEAANIHKFVAAVESLALPADVDVAMCFIEDGSTDDTLGVLRTLSSENPHVHYVSMANGFGEGPAVMFGLRQSRADAMIMMAVESHPPELIPSMIGAFLDGAQVVQCVRDSFVGRERYRDIATALFVPAVQLLTGFDYAQQNVYYRLVSRDFAQEVLASPRYWRFLRFPLPDETSGALKIIHADMAERESGQSQYTVTRLLGLALDGILICIATPRMVALSLALTIGALGLLWLGFPALGVVVVAGTAALWYRYYWLRTADHIAQLVVAERDETRNAGSAQCTAQATH